jgi:N-carbamoylputrescine amidase
MDTPLGRVGIGICADNHFGAHLRRLQAAAVDVVIMPHASPSPAGTSRIVDQRDLARSERIPVDLVTVYATMLGVPVALVNAIGILPPMEGMLGRMMKNGKFILAGRSCLVNADGVVVGKMQAEEGFMILDTGRKGKPAEAEIKTYDGDWLHPGNPFLRRMILPIDEKRGARAYAKWTRGT